MANALPISRLIRGTLNLSPIGAQMQNISTLLILGSSDVIDVVERFRTYADITEVIADFGTTSPEYLAAVLWFEQNPQPTTLQIGRWAQTATAGKLLGATLSSTQQTIATWNAVTSGSFYVVIDGVPLSITGLNFSTATNLNGVASTIKTAVDLLSAGVNVVWNSNFSRFEFESGTTGTSSSVSFISAPTATGHFTFTGNPANLDFITLNGTAVTFVTGTPVGNQVKIGLTLTDTFVSLLSFLNSSIDVQLVKFKYFVVGSVLYVAAASSGVGGDSLTIAASSLVITASGATLTGATGTDVSTMLAATSTSSGAYVANGIAAETALSAVTLFDTNYGQGWYAVEVLGTVDADILAISAYIEATTNKHLHGVTTQEAGVLSSVSTTDIASQLKTLGYNRTVVQYSSSNLYAVSSLLARILTTDYNANNSVITLMYKQEPGIIPETLNTTQIDALEAKNCNVFVAYNNNTAIVEQGKVSSGEFVDVITGTDWFVLDAQTELYNILYTSTTKIPQTDAGMNVLVTALDGICAQAVRNGLFAPGVWNAGGFGALNQGDFMAKGYYIYASPMATQSQADRAARKSTVIQIAGKLAGAIHTVDFVLNVNA